jgi:hypothetical protein
MIATAKADWEKSRAALLEAKASLVKSDAEMAAATAYRRQVDVDTKATDELLNKQFVDPTTRMGQLNEEIVRLEERLKDSETTNARLDLVETIQAKQREKAVVRKVASETFKDTIGILLDTMKGSGLSSLYPNWADTSTPKPRQIMPLER